MDGRGLGAVPRPMPELLFIVKQQAPSGLFQAKALKAMMVKVSFTPGIV